MKFRLYIAALHAALLCILLAASPAGSGSMTLLGAGKAGAAAPAYVGPGDIVSGASAWWSCARAYNAAFAATQGAMCDLVNTSTGASACTLHVKTNGFADLTSPSCVGGTVSVTTFCTITNPGGCSVAQAYDQTGNANHSSAIFGQQPVLTLNALNGLPVLLLSSAGSTRLAAVNTITSSIPLTLSTVVNNTSGSVGGIISPSSPPALLKAGPLANQVQIDDGTTNPAVTMSDGAWHGVQAVVNAAATAINVSGTDSPSLAGTATSLSAATIRIGRDPGGSSMDGSWAEGGIWLSGFNATQRGNMYTNQNGANGYNGAV